MAETSADKPIPLATFQELVAQYHHRLLSLEADLKDKARAGALSAAALSKRVKKIKQVHASLNQLQRACIAEAPGKLMAQDIGLPILDDCTPDERQVCEQFLIEREEDLLELEAESAKVYRWLTEAVTGRTGPMRLILRLSKMRRIIQTIEKSSTLMAETSKALTAHVEKLLAAVRTPGAKEAGRSTLDGLMALFQQLDGTISRVARLRASVKKEDERTKAMGAWLRAQEAHLRTKAPPQLPPTPLETAKAAHAAGVQQRHIKTGKRQRLLEEFWEEVVHDGKRLPDDKELARAAMAIKSGEIPPRRLPRKD